MDLDWPNGTQAIWSKDCNDNSNNLLSVKYTINQIEA
jgi:hypothetical protein